MYKVLSTLGIPRVEYIYYNKHIYIITPGEMR